MPELLVHRDDLRSCRLVEGEPQERDLAEGEAQLLVERFSLSSNNITYAVMGEQPGCWRSFPGARRQGRIPAWGYGARDRLALARGGRGDARVRSRPRSAGTSRSAPAPHAVGFVDAAAHPA